FRAYDAIGHMTTDSITITVDNDIPSAEIVAPVPQEYVQGTYTFRVFASDSIDVVNVYITVNGIDYTTGYNSAIGYWEVTIDTATILDGTYDITATAEDGVLGHVQTTNPFNFNIDNNEPLLMINSPLNGEYVRGSVSLNVIGNDMYIDLVEYNVDGTGWGVNTTAWDTTIFTDGEHTVTIRAQDLAGHITEEAITVIVDNTDTDGDGIGDLADLDIDGDGVDNSEDLFPYDSTDWIDIDSDGTGDNTDDDDDGDGVPDTRDDFPLNSNEWVDTDGDGIGDNSDFDIDADGVYNINDAFPYNASEWSDIDGDGLGDNSDDDMDGDGVLNDDDAFPINQLEWRETDNDGIGDNADEDDDGDGVPDINDAFPLDFMEWRDTDKDGVGDNHDEDIDGDGVSNDDDEFPYNTNEWKDTDNDGIGDGSDPDDDNDGIVDREDYYPLDKSRYLEPFWWWWILIAMLIITLMIVIFITQRKSHDVLGDEEEYMVLSKPAFEKPPEKVFEEKLKDIEKANALSEERTKRYDENDLKNMRKTELVKIAKGMGLATTGTKPEIISRIVEAQFGRMVEEAEKYQREPEEGKEEVIECPSCGRDFKIKVEEFPTVIKCPHCGTSGTID
ncbi:MAG: thrombospondin type 3 repeat-containing protein, partial [Thermoplasmata archaeon]